MALVGQKRLPGGQADHGGPPSDMPKACRSGSAFPDGSLGDVGVAKVDEPARAMNDPNL